MIFLEGAGDLVLPCAAALVVPGLLVAIGSTRRIAASFLFAAVAGIGLWARAARLIEAEPSPWIVAGLFVAAGVALALRTWTFDLWGAAAAGTAAAWMWEPCVGLHLGEALTTAIYRPGDAFVPLITYTMGLLSVILVAAVAIGRTRLRKPFNRPPVRWISLSLFAALATAAATGWYGDAVSSLVRLSYELGAS